MAVHINYQELFKKAESLFKAAEARAAEADAQVKAAEAEAEAAKAEAEAAKAQVAEADARAALADARTEEANVWVKAAQKQLAKTAFFEFLDICHSNVFMKLDVERNKLLSTTGGLTSVDGKQYPRSLQPWTEFDALHDESFAVFERAFRSQELFPSPAGLGYLADKLSDKKLASEEDLKNFECLAVEGCVLDVLPRFLELVSGDTSIFPMTDPPRAISFNNYPFGVIAAESDEEHSEPEAEVEADEGSSSQREQSRGRTQHRPLRKPLLIKDDRPAYIGALGTAKRDMDAAAARAAAEAEERETSGPPMKRRSPERTKVHPDQWCFRHCADDTIDARPLFVIEYKAAHKISDSLLRDCLVPETAASLMEGAIRTVAGQNKADNVATAKRDIAKVFTQVFHYMIDYGLQYSYATTGNALIFLHIDLKQPTTLYYHLEEPIRAVQSAEREDVKRSAVALVLSFVLMSMKGEYMTQRWKKSIHKEQPKWPQPYADMKDMKDMPTNTLTDVSLGTTTATLASRTAEASRDPQKRSSTHRQGRDDERNPSPMSLASDTTRSSCASSNGTVGTATTQVEPDCSYAGNVPVSPTLAFCTQACLLGLKTGGKKDPRCPNVHLHRRSDAEDEQHPITADELRTKLTQQLADDMDHDCQNLERYGMYGAIGALFKLALSEYGYCFVGKGVQRVHCKQLEQEALAYSFLEACQGQLVPVVFGVIELEDEYWTQCGAHISHMMLMSFAGESLWHHGRKTHNPSLYHEEMMRTLEELEPYGVVHGDENNNNMVWNEELQRVMAIDFDRAVVPPQPADADLAKTLSAGGQDKRKEAFDEHDKKETKRAKLEADGTTP
ncbi:phosphotransferase-like protein [Grosmannia clavigera kw1407]|uniref:Phosphotransferase-like protein n=1 Tax=Grosmannia clavigera (strain kw1407 / UAMH 11150) TaxID=655863 RepID=F0XLB4_GROCL|nr:phosphotransferase-like protein [Grosmannia clavigera kw1407]EFX01076.1 phosphotransferase-like protein [Grosmannia clavigera kw1407]